jgi:hypothetical protein
VNVRQTAVAFELLEVKDGEFFAWAKHGRRGIKGG